LGKIILKEKDIFTMKKSIAIYKLDGRIGGGLNISQ